MPGNVNKEMGLNVHSRHSSLLQNLDACLKAEDMASYRKFAIGVLGPRTFDLARPSLAC
jgi:hypothetical protein